MTRHNKTRRTIIVGAGPAGLTAAYLLAKQGRAVTVLEADPTYVGGISRTVKYRDFHIDIGGHRFYTRSPRVEALWHELLPQDLVERPRKSRIRYREHFFSYPLKPFEALWKLGPLECALCVLSYLRAATFPVRNPTNFEDWVSNRFGKRLFRIFFKTYTEKVWGMDCREISADWASQRIQGLSLGVAVWKAVGNLFGPGDRGTNVKSLIEKFLYPRRGPGMLWEACAEKIRTLGGEIRLGCPVRKLNFDDRTGKWTVEFTDRHGTPGSIHGDDVISSAALGDTARAVSPPLSVPVAEEAAKLRHRDFIVVAIVVKDRSHLSDNWIYIHDPTVRVGRIQNFKAWSADMCPDPQLALYGMEYFCTEGDPLWSSKDEELAALARRELAALSIAAEADILDACVIRQKKAYPVYDEGYVERVARVRGALEERFPTLHLVGRNGLHRYNNQDHAMMTAMLTVENIVAERRIRDVGKVNQDAIYVESGLDAGGAASGERLVPSVAPRRRAG